MGEAPRALVAGRGIDYHMSMCSRTALLLVGVLALAGESARGEPPAAKAVPGNLEVRDFGALGDGVQDDTRALQTALDLISKTGYGTLGFEAQGVYRIAACLRVSNAKLRIEGRGATIKPLDVTPVRTRSAQSLEASGCSGVIRGLTFDGNKRRRGEAKNEVAQGSLVLTGCSDLEVCDCTFFDGVDDDLFVCAVNGGTPATVSKWIKIHDNRFIGPSPYRQCVSIVHGQHVVIERNEFRDQRSPFTGNAVDIEANPADAEGINSDISVCDNVFDNCRTALLIHSARNPRNVVVSGNRISNGDIGISNNTKGTVISANVFRSQKGICILSINGGTATIDSNKLYDCTDTGIYLDTTGKGQVVINNVLQDVGPRAGAGICLVTAWAGGGALVNGNVVRSSTPRPTWTAYQVAGDDVVGVNWQFNCAGADGVRR